MGDLVYFPGVFRPELEEATPLEKVLAGVMVANLREIVYVGRAMDGEIIVGGTSPDADAAIGLLARGVNALAGAQQVHLEESENPTG